MEIINLQLKRLFANAINKIFEKDLNDKIFIESATKPEFGDFQTNFAMVTSKIINKNPREIANQLVENFPENDLIEKLEVAGPGFINIFLKNSFINNELKKIGTERYDFSFLNTDKTVIIDYSSPNVAKRMHIGHLRSTIIGDSIKRIMNFIGYKTISDNHIGDWGTQFGKLIVAYKKWLDKQNYEKDPIGELERLYVLFSEKAKENSELENIARNELYKLQNGDEENLILWNEFIQISLKEYDKIYKKLDISFDYYFGESHYNKMMPTVLTELKDKGIAVEDQGALVVFFDNDKLPPAIVQKKDGSFLYTTSDIATIKFRKEKLNVDKAIYVTDDRQQVHFKQIFEISNMLNGVYNYDKHHVYFGIMRFGDGQIFSSRSGNIIRLSDLIDEAQKHIEKVIEEKNPSINEEERNKIAEIIGIGAIKYFDLSQNRTSDVLFTWDKVLSFEGNTGPYLQYTYVRIMSLLRKLVEENIEYNLNNIVLENTNGVSRILAVSLLNFPQIIYKASETFKPNLIADYLFETAKLFNNLYNNEPIIKDNDPESRNSKIALAVKTAEILKEGLSLLGIKTVDKM